MAKSKTQPAAASTPVAPPTDYEQGFFDCLKMLREEVSRQSDAQREAIRLVWNAAPEVQSLLNFASSANNIVGDVANRVETRAIRHLTERRQAEKVDV